jgi:hypothetical protein
VLVVKSLWKAGSVPELCHRLRKHHNVTIFINFLFGSNICKITLKAEQCRDPRVGSYLCELCYTNATQVCGQPKGGLQGDGVAVRSWSVSVSYPQPRRLQWLSNQQLVNSASVNYPAPPISLAQAGVEQSPLESCWKPTPT